MNKPLATFLTRNSGLRRNTDLALLFVASCFLVGCQTLSADGPDVQATWREAQIVVPAEESRQRCAGRGRHDCLQQISGDKKLPVVVYMHGCTGPNIGVVDDFARFGYITVAPNSLARAKRTVDCEVGSNKKQIMQLRFQEAAYAARMLKELPMVDQKRLILAGFSEGGVTAALHPGDEYAARVILGWTCTSSDSWWTGIRGPRNAPALAIVGGRDHYYLNNVNAGQCRVGARPKSRSIVLKDVGHDIVFLPETWRAVEEFLQNLP